MTFNSLLSKTVIWRVLGYPGPAGCRVSFEHLGRLAKIRANPRGLGEGALAGARARGCVYVWRRALVWTCTHLFSNQRIFGATKGRKSGGEGAEKERERD